MFWWTCKCGSQAKLWLKSEVWLKMGHQLSKNDALRLNLKILDWNIAPKIQTGYFQISEEQIFWSVRRRAHKPFLFHLFLWKKSSESKYILYTKLLTDTLLECY